MQWSLCDSIGWQLKEFSTRVIIIQLICEPNVNQPFESHLVAYSDLNSNGRLEVNRPTVNGDSRVHDAEWIDGKLLDFMSRYWPSYIRMAVWVSWWLFPVHLSSFYPWVTGHTSNEVISFRFIELFLCCMTHDSRRQSKTWPTETNRLTFIEDNELY